MRMYDVIEKKRDGKELSYDEINYFIKNYCDELIPDYQVSALLMAIFLQGMNEREIADLTEIMANSGDVIDLSSIQGIKIDKHSTGGVGDKTTLILGPIVAACGVPVAKMSGRGLGHTGGTIDKLESIPGFKTDLTKKEFIDNVNRVGISVAGQTGNLAPADKKLYALRDVTATVNSIPLIASSIMSKKIACGADRIVLDVKTGSGAFMKTVEKSVELAETMVKIGNNLGRRTVAIVTDMDIPLGSAIGNSLEVIEAIETLKGNGPKDLEEVSLSLASKMLELAEIGDRDYCNNKAKEVLENGQALNKLAEMIETQGGNPDIIENYDIFKKPKHVYELTSGQDCYLERVKTDMLGISSMILGAGRETKDSVIDYSAGIKLNKKTGMSIRKGELIATLYADDNDKINQALQTLKKSLILSDSVEPQRPLILSNIE
ncbi:MAG: pyrimidine-nucleoside phosphorylase [Clostridiaceae bacterium]|jgi:pyrimidine-nucleoside phosphorylase|nr:pyrimidine-nucleoside phosphorylase [Clostridiaceae bacterium]